MPDSSCGKEDRKAFSPPAKIPHLFSGYGKKASKKRVAHDSSVKDELIHYIKVASDEVQCLAAWKMY